MGEQSVVADGYAQAGQHVEHGHHAQVEPADRLVPEQDNRHEEGDHRQGDADHVADLLRPVHGLERYPSKYDPTTLIGGIIAIRILPQGTLRTLTATIAVNVSRVARLWHSTIPRGSCRAPLRRTRA